MTDRLYVRQPLVDTSRYSDELCVHLIGQQVTVVSGHDHQKPIARVRILDARLAEDGSLDLDLGPVVGESTRRWHDRLLTAFETGWDREGERHPISIGYLRTAPPLPQPDGTEVEVQVTVHAISPAYAHMAAEPAAPEPEPEPKRGDVRPSGLIIG